MIWVIIAVFVGISVFCGYKSDDGIETGWTVGSALSCIFAGIAFFLAIIMIVFVVDASTADERIAMYEAENQKIEAQMAEIVEKYQAYESGIFAEVNEKNAMSLVCLYPELKSDSLVSEQMSVYIENNEEIKESKEEKISARPYKWFLYFGG